MRKLRGVITSNKMKNTVVVRADSFKTHPKYKKYYRVSKKYKAHVANEKDYSIGDEVIIQETRPISKEKRWKVAGVTRKMNQLIANEPGEENFEATKSEKSNIKNQISK